MTGKIIKCDGTSPPQSSRDNGPRTERKRQEASSLAEGPPEKRVGSAGNAYGVRERLALGRRYVSKDLDSPERMANDSARRRLHDFGADQAEYIGPAQSTAADETRCENRVRGADAKTGGNPGEPEIIQLFVSVRSSDRTHVRLALFGRRSPNAGLGRRGRRPKTCTIAASIHPGLRFHGKAGIGAADMLPATEAAIAHSGEPCVSRRHVPEQDVVCAVAEIVAHAND
jgi:hypothetical protein